MLQVVIRHKRRTLLEDEMTSAVFGAIELAPPPDRLILLEESLGLDLSTVSSANSEIAMLFWPRVFRNQKLFDPITQAAIEPDLLLCIPTAADRTHLVCIEVKWGAGQSSHDPVSGKPDQVDRQYRAIKRLCGTLGITGFDLVYLTKDGLPPTLSLPGPDHTSTAASRSQVRWRSWADALSGLRRASALLSPSGTAVCSQVINALEILGVHSFRGVPSGLSFDSVEFSGKPWFKFVDNRQFYRSLASSEQAVCIVGEAAKWQPSRT